MIVTYTLPDLPDDASALEAHISGRIMELHHDKHHAAYVKGANTALAKLNEIREHRDFSAISMLEKILAFNVRPRAPLGLLDQPQPRRMISPVLDSSILLV